MMEHGDVAARVEAKVERRSTDGWTGGANEDGPGIRQVGRGSIGIGERDVFADGHEGEGVGVIEAEKPAAGVDQQVKTLEKVIAEDPADIRICSLQLGEFLDDHGKSCDRLLPRRHEVEGGESLASV